MNKFIKTPRYPPPLYGEYNVESHSSGDYVSLNELKPEHIILKKININLNEINKKISTLENMLIKPRTSCCTIS